MTKRDIILACWNYLSDKVKEGQLKDFTLESNLTFTCHFDKEHEKQIEKDWENFCIELEIRDSENFLKFEHSNFRDMVLDIYKLLAKYRLEAKIDAFYSSQYSARIIDIEHSWYYVPYDFINELKNLHLWFVDVSSSIPHTIRCTYDMRNDIGIQQAKYEATLNFQKEHCGLQNIHWSVNESVKCKETMYREMNNVMQALNEGKVTEYTDF